MNMRLGIIQTRGLGDIIIAAPIAYYFKELGYDIYWPIDSRFLSSFECAFPSINFIPVDSRKLGVNTEEYFYSYPSSVLKELNCEKIICLYSYLSGLKIINTRLSESLSFDMYKYAVSKVPFVEKWNLKIKRNIERELELCKSISLELQERYILLHEEGSNFKIDLKKLLPDQKLRIVRLSEVSDNIFDWLSVIENASVIVMIDSVYSNLVDQLKIPNKKYLYLRSPFPFTPVLMSNWEFI